MSEKAKVLILSASPKRDKYIDELIAMELRKKGHEVWVRPCLREGRDAVLELKPDVVVVPPIRNPYSRDFVVQLKKWGCGVVTRHTEPSCSWQDWKKMDEQQRLQIWGAFPYPVDVEIVWSQDEAEILARRRTPFPVASIGSVNADVYTNADYKKRFFQKDVFNVKHKFSNKKKTLLIASPWGFADSAPDLQIDDNTAAQKDIAGRDRHFAMIRKVHAAVNKKWNILITTHPGVMEGPYQELAKELQVPLDSESPMIELLINCDAVVHAGSTAAISAHLLNIAAFQFGDVNAKGSNSWWGMPDSAISRVSPYCMTPEDLIQKLSKFRKGSNANKATLKELETGRYGPMDGKATVRAAEVISKIQGKFVMCWPDSPFNYTQPGAMYQTLQDVIKMSACGVCKKQFVIMNDALKVKGRHYVCPWCGTRVLTNDSGIGTGATGINPFAPQGSAAFGQQHCAGPGSQPPPPVEKTG